MEALDLTQVPVVDNHCHGLLRDQAFEDIASWRQAFTESTDPGMPRDHVASTALYRRLIRMLASFLGCEPEEEAVFTARIGRDGSSQAHCCAPRTPIPSSWTRASRLPKKWFLYQNWESSHPAARSRC